MYCTNCRQPITDQMNVCPNCGHRLKSTPNPVAQPAPTQPQTPQVVYVVPQQPVQKISWGKSILKVVLSFILSFAVMYGLISAFSWARPYIGDFMPFLGLYSPRAGGIAQNYVDNYFPEFSSADRTISNAVIEGETYYVVDFVLEPPQGPQGLRVLVSRNLDEVFVLEYVDGR